MTEKRRPRPISEERIQDLRAWYPEVRPLSDEPDLFEIGLVIAGGQSAGCYLGGVLDFLFEALDCWHAAKIADPEGTPNHRVKVKAVVGTSAGGLNTAIVGVCAPHSFKPAAQADLSRGDENLGSPFYRAWVRDIDVIDLLACDDLDSGGEAAAFNGRYLERRVSEYLGFKGDGPADPRVRGWLQDPLPLKVVFSNISGVNYGIRFTHDAERDPADESGYAMTLHQDHASFLRPLFIPSPATPPPDYEWLATGNDGGDQSWARLGDAGLASISFPGALQARTVERPNTDYMYRFIFPNAPEGLVYARPTPAQPPGPFRFSVVDGGIVNNEPFELAHAILAGSEGSNPRGGHEAKRAVLLIDPFINPPPPPTNEPLKLLDFPARLYAALTQQTKFKIPDVALAQSGEVYSRFMIAPVRHTGGGNIRGDRALASGGLGSFLGYFSEPYRHHDFMLGRYNCHRFLRSWFCLPSTQGLPELQTVAPSNSLFDGWSAAALANEGFHSQANPDQRQIIPLLGSAAIEPARPAWPAGAYPGWSATHKPFGRRVDALYRRLKAPLLRAAVRNGVFRWIAHLAVGIAWRLGGRRKLLNLIGSHIDAAVKRIDDDAAD